MFGTPLAAGQRVDFIHNQPFGALAPEILPGTVMEVSTTKRGEHEYFIQPDNKYRMGRWRKDAHIIAVGEVSTLKTA